MPLLERGDIERMKKMVEMGGPDTRIRVLQRIIGQGGERAIGVLHELGNHHDKYVRRAVVEVLLYKRTHEFIPMETAINMIKEIIAKESSPYVLEKAMAGLESHLRFGSLTEKDREMMQDLLDRVKKKLGVDK